MKGFFIVLSLGLVLGQFSFGLEESKIRLRVGLAADWVGRQDLRADVYSWRPAFGIDLGWNWKTMVFGVSWRRMVDETMEGAQTAVATENQGLIWVRNEWPIEAQWKFWGELGVGLRQTFVDSQIQGDSQSLSSDPELVNSLSFGFSHEPWKSWLIDFRFQALKAQTRLSYETSAGGAILKTF